MYLCKCTTPNYIGKVMTILILCYFRFCLIADDEVNRLSTCSVHSQFEVFLMINLKGKVNVCRDERFQISIVCIL